MTFDRNSKPVQFIQPNVVDRACLSVGKDAALRINLDCAAPYSLKIPDARSFTDGVLVPFGRAVCAVPRRLNAKVCPSAQHRE